MEAIEGGVTPTCVVCMALTTSAAVNSCFDLGVTPLFVAGARELNSLLEDCVWCGGVALPPCGPLSSVSVAYDRDGLTLPNALAFFNPLPESPPAGLDLLPKVPLARPPIPSPALGRFGVSAATCSSLAR